MAQGFDLAVIGGGPGGAAAAWNAARRGLRVALVERGGFPRDRVCGEFISAEARPVLEAMAPELLEDAPEIASAELIASHGRRARIALPRPGMGIPRWRLDQALWEAAGRAGVTHLAHTTVTGARREHGGWQIEASRGGGLRAEALIVGAGRWWHVRGLNAPPRPRSPWIGIKARFRGPGAAGVELYAFRGGYCGVAPVSGGEVNVCALIHRRAARALGGARKLAPWLSWTAGSASLARRLAGLRQASPTLTTAPVPLGRGSGGRHDLLPVGDASGFLDPFTGDGLARALLGGWAAAAAVDEGNPGRYRSESARAARLPFALSAALRGLLQAPPWAQDAALWAMARPALGGHIVRATRCRLRVRL